MQKSEMSSPPVLAGSAERCFCQRDDLRDGDTGFASLAEAGRHWVNLCLNPAAGGTAENVILSGLCKVQR